MARYIDADKAVECLRDICAPYEESREVKDEAIEIIADFHTADVAEVKHGEWVLKNGYITCSECGCEPYALARRIDFDNLHHYCPACGAKMDGGNDKRLMQMKPDIDLRAWLSGTMEEIIDMTGGDVG